MSQKVHSLLCKIYKNVFPDEKLSKETKKAIYRVVKYISKDNPGEYHDNSETKERFVKALEAAVTEYQGKSLKDIMSGRKTDENVMLRNICYAIYMNNFPAESSSKVSKIFGSYQNPSTIRRNMSFFRKGFKLHEKTKKIYSELSQKTKELFNAKNQ